VTIEGLNDINFMKAEKNELQLANIDINIALLVIPYLAKKTIYIKIYGISSPAILKKDLKIALLIVLPRRLSGKHFQFGIVDTL